MSFIFGYAGMEGNIKSQKELEIEQKVSGHKQ